MTIGLHRETAKIYEFPVRGRAGVIARQEAAAAEAKTPRLPQTSFGSGWYHDAAIADAERAPKS